LCDLHQAYQSAIWRNEPIEIDSNITLEAISRNITLAINEVILRNPNSFPTENWKNKSGQNDLNGVWKLRFTNAPDATFKPGKRGPATRAANKRD
jgi:hypothetical protein